MKKKIMLLVTSILLILALPITIISVGFALPSVFKDTYYGELSVMYTKLKESKKQKIVFIGNSAVAFGINTDLVQSEFKNYDVVNFGLYGAIGTKTMIELSRNFIKKDDIVVLTVEPYKQTSSLYFSSKEIWRAADPNMEILGQLPSSMRSYMVGGFVSFTAEKYKYNSTEEKPMNTGAYKREAFIKDNKDIDYNNYDRPYNIMKGGYDNANLPIIDESLFGEGYLYYLNQYASELINKGASIYYGFSPVNDLAIDGDKLAKADALYDYLLNKLKFPLLNNPAKYFLDYRYFYDNNVHLNNAGMIIYSDLLVEDIKLALNIKTENHIPLIDPPEIPVEEDTKGSNIDLDKFNYEIVEGKVETYVRITGLNDLGKEAVTLTIPSRYNDLPIREFSKETFQNNSIISSITLPKNIHTIYDDSFINCPRLSSLYFEHDSILGINVGINYLNGAPNCFIYLKKSVSIADCAGGWEKYQSRIRYY